MLSLCRAHRPDHSVQMDLKGVVTRHASEKAEGRHAETDMAMLSHFPHLACPFYSPSEASPGFTDRS
jgi:hypothetical protein